MKLAFFENEFGLIEGIFTAYNLIYRANSLIWEVFKSSQEMPDLRDILNYDIIVIDIDLSKNSTKDGFQLINDIYLINPNAKIIVLTGHLKIREKLKENIKHDHNYPIIEKPVTIDSIKDAFKFYAII